MKSLTSRLYLSKRTVFSVADIAIIWQETNSANLKSKLNYYCKSGQLISLRRGVYVLDRLYNKYELANTLYSPSYISLETVLLKEGVIFQQSETITSVGYLTREIIVAKQKYSYRKILASALTHPFGIVHGANYSIASKERAFLDSLYLNQTPYFDRLEHLDWDECRRLLPIYENKQLIKRFSRYAHP